MHSLGLSTSPLPKRFPLGSFDFHMTGTTMLQSRLVCVTSCEKGVFVSLSVCQFYPFLIVLNPHIPLLQVSWYWYRGVHSLFSNTFLPAVYTANYIHFPHDVTTSHVRYVFLASCIYCRWRQCMDRQLRSSYPTKNRSDRSSRCSLLLSRPLSRGIDSLQQ